MYARASGRKKPIHKSQKTSHERVRRTEEDGERTFRLGVNYLASILLLIISISTQYCRRSNKTDGTCREEFSQVICYGLQLHNS